jgi:RHS repeat-associated protein
LCYSGTDANCANAAASNNGNLLRQRMQVQGSPSLDLTQSYGYDAFNRLLSASETAGTGTAWAAITYGMDRFGNRWVEAGYKPNLNLTPQSAAEFNAASNRMTAPNAYDAVGNLTSNKVSQKATYDAENRMITFNGGLGVASYRYDGDGRRISQQTAAGVTTYYVYNASGQLAAEYSTQAPAGSGTSYLTTDHLGSTRIVTDAAGTPKTRHDYVPYGEEIDPQYGGRASIPGYTATLLDGPTQKFTAKERDSESNLDYFGARYFSGAQGRFTSPDLGPLDMLDPQSINRYSYALNNPLRYVDEDGLTAKDRVNAANKLANQNIPYLWGGKDPSIGLDCSGLCQNVFATDPDNDISLSGLNTRGQAAAFKESGDFITDFNKAEAGDEVFFQNAQGKIEHVGIVVDVKDGRIYFVHAPGKKKIVRRDSFSIKTGKYGQQSVAGFGRPSYQSQPSGQSLTQSLGFFSRVQLFFHQYFPSYVSDPRKPNQATEPKPLSRSKRPIPKLIPRNHGGLDSGDSD